MNHQEPKSILHIAFVNGDYSSGVSTIVPQLLKWQNKIEPINVALLNLDDYIPDNAAYPVFFEKKLSKLPLPFNKPDLIVFHEIYRMPFLHFLTEARRQGIPYIITPHGSLNSVAQKQHHVIKTFLNKLFFDKFVKQAAYVHFLTYQEQNQSSAFKTTNSYVLPNGIAIPDADSYESPNDKKDIVFIGRLDIHVKGLDLLLSATEYAQHELRRRGLSVKIYGPDCNGSFEKLKNQVRACGVTDVCQICGPALPDMKKDILTSALCYIQLSRTEGFPTSVLEALSYGLPIIVSEGTTWKDAARELSVGIGVDSDPASISDAIFKIADDTYLRSSMSENAIRVTRDNYSWRTIASQHASIYMEIIREAKSSQP